VQQDTMEIDADDIQYFEVIDSVKNVLYSSLPSKIIAPNESCIFNLKTKDKLQISFKENARKDSIYPKSNVLINRTKLFCVFNLDTIEIKKSKDFFIDSNVAN